MVRFVLIASGVVVLAGCANIGYQSMSPEQLKALGKEANISYTEGNSILWGNFRNIFMNIDKSVIDKGGISIGKDGTIELRNERQFTPPKLSDPKLPALPELQWSTTITPGK